MREFITLVTLFASASTYTPHQQTLIISDPPNATVLIDDRSIGETPLRYSADDTVQLIRAS
jgi:hypothetical protein